LDGIAQVRVDDATVDAYLEERGSDFASRVRVMERAEPWALDAQSHVKAGGPNKIQDLLAQLEAVLQAFVQANLQVPAPQVTQLLALLRSGRALALISWSDEMWPGNGVQLLEHAIEHADKEEGCFLLLDRMQHLDRVMLLSRVFSMASIRDVLEAIDSIRAEDREVA
jgi:hypothetical protein